MDIASASLARRIADVLSGRPEVLDAYLFGSRARGDAAAHSDIDVAVFVDRARLAEGRDAPFGYDAELTAVLMAALETNDIDLVVLNEAGPVLYHRVLRDGARLVSRDLAATTAREGAALSRYCDYVPQLAAIDAAFGARVLGGDFGR